MAVIHGEILTKPGTKERAVEQLMRLAGQSHRLLTAVALHDPRSGETWDDLVVYEMRMRSLTRELAERYIERDQPLDCAGSYKIESTGMALFEEVKGPDHTAIIGLPLTSVSRLLRAVGVDTLARSVNAK
jgi:septum formation protein